MNVGSSVLSECLGSVYCVSVGCSVLRALYASKLHEYLFQFASTSSLLGLKGRRKRGREIREGKEGKRNKRGEGKEGKRHERGKGKETGEERGERRERYDTKKSQWRKENRKMEDESLKRWEGKR